MTIYEEMNRKKQFYFEFFMLRDEEGAICFSLLIVNDV